MMDLLDRYFDAIRRNLPAGSTDDIVAELREGFASLQEDREGSLGRALTRDELCDLIKQFGHPWVVASRYRPNQWLIGPDVFPFYERVMRIVLLVVGAIIIAAAALSATFGGQPAWQAALHAVGNLFLYGLINAGIVTLIFAILERNGFPADHLRRWSPTELPDVADEKRGKWEGPIEVALTMVFILWWTGVVRWPFGAVGDGFRLEPAPIWEQLFWPVLILASARLVHNLIQWLRPRWKFVRGVFGLATAAGALALLVIVWQAGEWVTVVSTGMPEEGARSLQDSLNFALRMAIVVVGIIWTLACLGELRRLVKSARSRAAAA